VKVVVIGGTRGLGHAVVVAAHAKGHTLTVMGRKAAGFTGPVSGLRMVQGDAEDPDDVERAVDGQQAVVWTVGTEADGIDVRVFSRGTLHVLQAMQAHGVRRLIAVTAIAAGAPPRGLVRSRVAQAVAADKTRQEARIRESAVDWTIVRPAALTGGEATGLFQTLVEVPGGRAKPIARADVADFIVDHLDAPDYVRKTVFVTA
jgi:uncharacterized protein YbjT (DUF2867 family)